MSFDKLPIRITMTSCKSCYKKMYVEWVEDAIPTVGRRVEWKNEENQNPGQLSAGMLLQISPRIIVCKDDGSVEILSSSKELVLGGKKEWCSWSDPMCGKYSAGKVLPFNAKKVKVRFDVWGGATVCEWDRAKRQWRSNRQEVFELPDDSPVDAHFHLDGPARHCAVVAVWNAAKGGSRGWCSWPGEASDAPAVNMPQRPKDRAVPATLVAARTAGASVEARRWSAARAFSKVQRSFLDVLKEEEGRMLRQHVGVNTVSTIGVGLGIASVATMVFPPVSIGLGIASAAVGASASAGDRVADGVKGPRVRDAMETYFVEAECFKAVQEQCLQSKPEEVRMFCRDVQVALDGAADGYGAISIGRGVVKAVKLGTRSADAVSDVAVAVKISDAATDAVPMVTGVDAGADVALGGAQAAKGISAVALTVGIVGSVFAVGAQIYSWSVLKSDHKVVRSVIQGIEDCSSKVEQLGEVSKSNSTSSC